MATGEHPVPIQGATSSVQPRLSNGIQTKIIVLPMPEQVRECAQDHEPEESDKALPAC